MVKFNFAGWSSLVAYKSLKLVVVGSNPTPATGKSKVVVSKRRKFKSAKEFENEFLKYLNNCKKYEKLPNVAGFCVFEDMNRDTFYAQEELYSDTFKKINDMLEDEALNCKCLSDGRVIFYMKNKCGYKDKQEIDTTSSNRIEIINDLPSGEE